MHPDPGADQLDGHIAQMQAQTGDQLVALNGSLPFMAPRMLWWQDQHPDLYRRINKVLKRTSAYFGNPSKAAEALSIPEESIREGIARQQQYSRTKLRPRHPLARVRRYLSTVFGTRG